MRKHSIALAIALILFVIPFFWLKPGFVDLGGDAGRLYFLDPLAVAKSLLNNPSLFGAPTYAFIPYNLYLFVLKTIMPSATLLISFSRGLLLSLAFFSIYLIAWKILSLSAGTRPKQTEWASIISGIVYLSFITQNGWAVSLETLNQIFLNPLIFYLLLQFVLTSQFLYAFSILGVSFFYSGNFGYSGVPQVLSFYPLAITFLLLITRFIFLKRIPWRDILILGLLFVGLHAFHLLPVITSILDKGSSVHGNIFSGESIRYAGVEYFRQNREALGKISTQLFQPSASHGQSVLVLLIPGILLLGMLKRPSKLIALLGIFFYISFFLVSANITRVGAAAYGALFYIPGFLMFRSFNEKWYYVYVFFYSLLFAVTFYEFIRSKQKWKAVLLGIIIIVSLGYRISPFLRGKAIDISLYQSKNVSSVFKVDPDLTDALSFVRTLSVDGKVLTLPLTFPYYQITHGKEGGAYVGVSMVLYLTGRPDFPGFWSFGPYKQFVFDALRDSDTNRFLQLLSFLNVRYVFYNSDTRVIDNFPGYPNTYTGDMYSSRDQLPVIIDQEAYKKLLASIDAKIIYEKGFYSIYELDDTKIRPLIYIPDVVTDNPGTALEGTYRSAFFEKESCEILSCVGERHQETSAVTYDKQWIGSYEVTVDLSGAKSSFPLILSEIYDSNWDLSFEDASNDIVLDHMVANGYANGWIIDPTKKDENSVLHGHVYLKSLNYLYIGVTISLITFLVLIVLVILLFVRRRYEKK
jgi:hypothetical protein